MANYQSTTMRIHITRMQSTARQIRVQAGEYRRTGRQLLQTVTKTWKGKDAEAFQNQLQGFEDDLEKMAKIMESYSSFLEQAAKAYRQAQDASVQQARGLWQ